jgi:hypothetical protein
MTTEPNDAGADAGAPEPIAGVIAESDVDWSERTSLFGDGGG